MEALIKKEFHLKNRICKVCDYGLANLNEMNFNSCKTRVTVLTELWRSYEENHVQLLCAPFYEHETAFFTEEDKFALTEQKYLTALGKFEEYLENLKIKTSAPETASFTEETGTSTQSILPAIDFPRFSGKFEDWHRFRCQFQSIVLSRTDFSNALKMQYLLSHLTEEIAAMVKHLPVTADQFEQAWKILIVIYEKNHARIKKYLDKLLSIKPMQSETAPEMRRIATTTIKILNELEALGQPIKYWDDLIIHLTISRIDFQSRTIWQLLLENSEDPNEQLSTYADLKKFLEIRQYTLELLEQAQSE